VTSTGCTITQCDRLQVLRRLKAFDTAKTNKTKCRDNISEIREWNKRILTALRSIVEEKQRVIDDPYFELTIAQLRNINEYRDKNTLVDRRLTAVARYVSEAEGSYTSIEIDLDAALIRYSKYIHPTIRSDVFAKLPRELRDMIYEMIDDVCQVCDRTDAKREKKVVVLVELHRAIIYTTKMSKQVTKSHVRDAVHMYSVN
jgi:hypothetical protein